MSAPEQGELVSVRNRRYVVSDVLASMLPNDPLQPLKPRQHVVSLASVDDDGLGDELQVVWEIEPGAQRIERGGLPEPTSFDSPERLEAFLDAVRWGAIASANTSKLQSPFRAGIDREDYQLEPVARALDMPRVSLLIADDVGLGKTIETGLVALELMLRHRARTAWIVCPAGLQIQWRDQMRDKFGLDFRIVDTDYLRELRRSRGIGANPWKSFPRLITSIDFIKRDRPMRMLREALPSAGESSFPRRYDLLIVDEAHNIAPSGSGRYAVDSQRTAAVRSLTPHFEHKLFLTATPHNGYPESFEALLELLDNQRFARGVRPDRAQLGTVMVRRLKSDLEKKWDGAPRFPPRVITPIEVAYSDAERQAHRLLREYTTLRQKSAKSRQESYAIEFVMKLLKKRLFSSPFAFSKTLEKHIAHASSGQSGHGSDLGSLRQRLEASEEEFADDDQYDEATGDAIAVATRVAVELSAEERRLLADLQTWAVGASGRPDSKTVRLIEWLRTEIRPNGQWTDTRVIIFTEYRDTQSWLQQLLAAEGMTSDGRLLTMFGGMPGDQREAVKAAFQASPDQSPVRILLATDAASEGIDLQNYCSRLIHYEIPWNPNRLEQRNGRVDRHGQQADQVDIVHFVGAGYRARTRFPGAPAELEDDLEFLMRAAIKVQAIREDLGKVGPVIAAQVEQAMLGRIERLDTVQAEKDATKSRESLRIERRIQEDVEKLQARLRESEQELRLSPERVESVVRVALEIAGQPPLQLIPLKGSTGRVFRIPAFTGSWSAALNGLEHPHTHLVRPITFDAAVAKGRDDVVLAHLNSRLVQMCLRLLRAEIWSSGGQAKLSRVTARVVHDAALEHPAVVAHARLVLTGKDGDRLHEELITAGGRIREGRFARFNSITEMERALDGVIPGQIPASVQTVLTGLWPNLRDPLLRAIEARQDDRVTSLGNLLVARRDSEANGIRAVLQELARSIEHELAEPERPEIFQLALEFNEQEQLDRDVSSLRRRLDEIPAEIEREVGRIQERYSVVEPRLFPVAVTFLVPQAIARDGGMR